jgi:arsenate reductase
MAHCAPLKAANNSLATVKLSRKHRYLRSVTNKAQAAYVVYHNPRCSKSRATLALLAEHGIEPVVIEYLKTPLSAAEIKALLGKLKLTPGELVRKSEDLYKETFGDKTPTDAQLIAAMAKHPVLIERPIVVQGERAALGRPPENILQLIKVSARK